MPIPCTNMVNFFETPISMDPAVSCGNQTDQVWGISETRDRKLSLKCAIADCPCKGKSI